MIRKDIVQRLRDNVNKSFDRQSDAVIRENINTDSTPKQIDIIHNNSKGMSDTWRKNAEYYNSLRDIMNTSHDSLLKQCENDMKDDDMKRALKKYLRNYDVDYDLNDAFDLQNLWTDLNAEILKMSGVIIMKNIDLANIERLMKLKETEETDDDENME